MSPIEKLLSSVNWIPTGAEKNQETPYVTHEGILNILEKEVRVVKLSNGMTVIPEEEIIKIFGE